MFATDQMIAETVCGKTFVDVGPLWETVHEKLSTARHFGATRLAAIDQFPADHHLWSDLKDRLASLGVDDYEALSMNVLDYQGEPFDVVYCSGVIYHAPDPISLLKKLHGMTGHKLILSSTVTKHVINNEDGMMVLPEGSLVFVPALSEANKKIVITEWTRLLGERAGGGLIDPMVWDVNDYYNWWWLFTPDVLDAMASAAGFKIHKTKLINGNHYVMCLIA